MTTSSINVENEFSYLDVVRTDGQTWEEYYSTATNIISLYNPSDGSNPKVNGSDLTDEQAEELLLDCLAYLIDNGFSLGSFNNAVNGANVSYNVFQYGSITYRYDENKMLVVREGTIRALQARVGDDADNLFDYLLAKLTPLNERLESDLEASDLAAINVLYDSQNLVLKEKLGYAVDVFEMVPDAVVALNTIPSGKAWSQLFEGFYTLYNQGLVVQDAEALPYLKTLVSSASSLGFNSLVEALDYVHNAPENFITEMKVWADNAGFPVDDNWVALVYDLDMDTSPSTELGSYIDEGISAATLGLVDSELRSAVDSLIISAIHCGTSAEIEYARLTEALDLLGEANTWMEWLKSKEDGYFATEDIIATEFEATAFSKRVAKTNTDYFDEWPEGSNSSDYYWVYGYRQGDEFQIKGYYADDISGKAEGKANDKRDLLPTAWRVPGTDYYTTDLDEAYRYYDFKYGDGGGSLAENEAFLDFVEAMGIDFLSPAYEGGSSGGSSEPDYYLSDDNKNSLNAAIQLGTETVQNKVGTIQVALSGFIQDQNSLYQVISAVIKLIETMWSSCSGRI